ncbi:MAG: DUF2652 domain-containing protein [Armatimonadetes bacterium]|nr:DUF2652 domain-containing protein [Armatimonadota bacterium]
MLNVQRGCLVLADIAGYSEYLSGVELTHCQDVLADLVGTIVAQTRGSLRLAKLEGDAVFCYGPDGTGDGSMLLALVESCYFAFMGRREHIRRNTTCQCNACRTIDRLNLKFLTHHGEYVIHQVAGSHELVGRDVVLAHRLLKNSVTEKLGFRGYALFTLASVQRYSLDPQALRMAKHADSYQDVGEVIGYVLDLEARWKEEEDRRAVYIPPGKGIELDQRELPAPPAVVWDYMTSPQKRPLWQGSDRVDQRNPRGVAGVGTQVHCYHGAMVIKEEILDFRPFRYLTFRADWGKTVGLMGTLLITMELTPAADGGHTRVSCRVVHERGLKQRLLLPFVEPRLRSVIRTVMDNLSRLLSSPPDEHN